MNTLKKTIDDLEALKVTDPEISAKLERLRERRDAYEQLLEGKKPLGGAYQKRVDKIKGELTKKTPETEAMEESMAETSKNVEAGKKLYASLTTTIDPTSFDPTDSADVAAFHSASDRKVKTGSSPYYDMNINDLMLDSVWGSGDSNFFASHHAAHPTYAKRMRASVTNDELNDLGKLVAKQPEVGALLLDAANLGTIAKTNLLPAKGKKGGGKYSRDEWKSAAESDMRDKVKLIAPNATRKQLIAMNKVVDAAVSHLRTPK